MVPELVSPVPVVPVPVEEPEVEDPVVLVLLPAAPDVSPEVPDGGMVELLLPGLLGLGDVVSLAPLP